MADEYTWGGDPNYTLSGSDNPYDYGFTGVGGTGPGSMYVLPGEGVGETADTGLTVPTDDSGYIGETGLPPGITPGTPGPGWNNPGLFGTFLADLKNSGLFGTAGNIFGGQYGPLGQLAAFGGLAALLNKLMGSQSQQPVGYQGGIPKFTYERQQTPMAQQRPEGYRPGQGGISYFAPANYQYSGYTPKTAQEFLTRPIAASAPVEEPAPTITPKWVSATTAPASSGSVPSYMIAEEANSNTVQRAAGGYMPSGIAMLAGGRYLRGPGDGVSDSIPAKFERSGQPARLADGEFVIDARTVSEIGNGSSEAGARKLYAMMDRVHKARKTAKRGEPSGADKYLPK